MVCHHRASVTEDWPEAAGKLLASGKVLHTATSSSNLTKVHDCLKKLSMDSNRSLQIFQAADT